MTDRPDNPPSSEELIRRARGGLGSPPAESAQPTDSGPPVESVPPMRSSSNPDASVDATQAAPPPDAAADVIPPDAEPATTEWLASTDAQTPRDPSSLLPDHFLPAQAPTQRPGLVAQLASKWRWIVAGIFVLVFLFNFLTADTAVDDLGVGDCFMSPSEDEISSVETVGCSELHDYEVFAFVDLRDRGEAFPGDAVLFDEAGESCFDGFLSYLGLELDDAELGTDYLYDVFIPGPSSWEAGNRESMCAIYAVDANFNPVSSTGTARGN